MGRMIRFAGLFNFWWTADDRKSGRGVMRRPRYDGIVAAIQSTIEAFLVNGSGGISDKHQSTFVKRATSHRTRTCVLIASHHTSPHALTALECDHATVTKR
jgi:hypothetical protein